MMQKVVAVMKKNEQKNRMDSEHVKHYYFSYQKRREKLLKPG
jgi:hypothetical protein